MNRPSLFARLLEPKAARGHWLTAGIVLAGALVCEIAARVSTIRPNGQALSNFFQRGDAGPVLRLYDRLAGDGMSRGTVAALGFMPYVSARMFTWLARSVSPTLDTRWSSQDGRVERKRWTVGLTFTLALIQSYGLARFTQALPGAVGQSGAEFVAETVVVQTAVAIFMMWVGEQVVGPTDADERASDAHNPSASPGTSSGDESASVLTSGQRERMLSPNLDAHASPEIRAETPRTQSVFRR